MSIHGITTIDINSAGHCNLRGIETGPQPPLLIEAVCNADGPQYLIIKEHGYTSNPGSRYSGLTSYYPGDITVYRVLEAKGERTYRCEIVASWQNTREKAEERAARQASKL